MKLNRLPTFILLSHLTAFLASAWATEVIIPVSADATSIEINGGTTNGGSDTSVQLNGRFAATVNEAIVLKFDISAVTDRTAISTALLRLTNYRSNTARTLHYWGVIDGAVPRDSTVAPAIDGTITDNTWTEADYRWTTVPGLDYDAVATTAGPITDRLVDLGAQTMNSATEGTHCTYNVVALANFLKDHPDSNVMILITVDTVSTGQSRFASREAQVLAGGGAAQPAGTFAPRLILDVANTSIDRDEDGLLNTWEEAHGLSPDDNDSDDNGTLDGAEDPDGDLLLNLGEQARGTLPTDPDTEDDGLSDNVETLTGVWVGPLDRGTNPLLADSDLDTLPDGLEDKSLPYVDVDQPGTDPNKADSDDDLYTDKGELNRASNPTSAASWPVDAGKLTILGTTTTSLLGSDLTDPENDIIDITPEGSGFDWTAISSNSRNYFGTGAQQGGTSQGAYDIFDNKLGPVNDKWCCDTISSGTPLNVTVQFPGTVVLTHFTISTPDDGPQRDPVDWQLQGSNDGVFFLPIFTQFDPLRSPIFTSRLQVVRADFAAPTLAYRYIRYECSRAASSQHALGELELFGTLVRDAEYKITAFSKDSATGDFSLSWQTLTGRLYDIEYSTDLLDWTRKVAFDISGTGDVVTEIFMNPLPSEPKVFFRIARR